jgi:hypothetical protein
MVARIASGSVITSDSEQFGLFCHPFGRVVNKKRKATARWLAGEMPT